MNSRSNRPRRTSPAARVETLAANSGSLRVSSDSDSRPHPEYRARDRQRRPGSGARRAGPAAGARPLSARLRGADRQPRFAAALSERGRGRGRPLPARTAPRSASRRRSTGWRYCRTSSGSFGLWSPGSQDLWLTAYVTDFLTRAQEKGYRIRSTIVETALDRLKNSVNYSTEFQKGGEELAYALYVLARSGRAVVGDLRYYVDEKLTISPRRSPRRSSARRSPCMATRSGRNARSAWRWRDEAEPDAGRRSPRAPTTAPPLRDGAATPDADLGNQDAAAKRARHPAGRFAPPRRRRTRPARRKTPGCCWRRNRSSTRAAARRWRSTASRRRACPARAERRRSHQRAAADQEHHRRSRSAPRCSSTAPRLTPEPAAASGFTIERQVYTPDGKEVPNSTG